MIEALAVALGIADSVYVGDAVELREARGLVDERALVNELRDVTGEDDGVFDCNGDLEDELVTLADADWRAEGDSSDDAEGEAEKEGELEWAPDAVTVDDGIDELVIAEVVVRAADLVPKDVRVEVGDAVTNAVPVDEVQLLTETLAEIEAVAEGEPLD